MRHAPESMITWTRGEISRFQMAQIVLVSTARQAFALA